MPSLSRLFSLPKPDGAANATRRLDEFAEKYQQFFPRVFAYVYGRVRNVQLAEDLVADVFERVFVKAASLRNNDAFATWLFTIARNVVTSWGRKSSRETVVDPAVLYAISPSSTSVENEILVREEVAAVIECLRRFPQREQDIVALKFDAGLSNRQIAAIMGLNEANVRVILFRTLRKLRQMMGARPGAVG